jgi:ADP-ribose pyrophosphatase YjhB (NUDIX family)
MTICDNRSVGVIIQSDGRYLMFTRNTFPWGVAPVAGHVDVHGSYPDAAHAEASEELGVNLIDLRRVTEGWRDNKCRREPGPQGVGHNWQVYRAWTASTPKPSQRETRNVRYLDGTQVQILAGRTTAYAKGGVTDEEFRQHPGIEPVWVQWLVLAGIIVVSSADLLILDQLASNGGRP